ncbi:endonuclease/exonuclease/phosphatase family protein [Alistipes sp.]|uniref:endonuclease/exonuclease/phosphatase family protein n=1 Tax=Alistipes sp. TaxID=1872444 RepID=UPI003A887B96
MERWVYDTDDSRSDKRRRGPLGRLFDAVFAVATMLVALLLLFMYLSPYVSPDASWVFSVLGLVAPVIYVAGIMLFLYWVVRWRWGYGTLLLALLLIGVPKISLYYKIDPLRRYGEPAYERSALKVMAYNVRMFYGDDGRSTVDSLAAFVGRCDPDILCLEEFNDSARGAAARFDSLIAPHYRRAVYSRDGAGTEGVSLAVYSKLRILASGRVDCIDDADTSRVAAVWADLKLGRDTVRVFCNHLRSTHIKSDDGEYLMNYRFLTDTARHKKLHSILSRLRYNSISRSHQVDTLEKLIAAAPRARIVCGDFNDTPLSYTYRLMSRGLQDAFRCKGRGYSHTFRGFYNTLRIDYVLVSDQFEVLSYEVPAVDFSDHRPVFVRLKYNSQTQ